MDAFANAETKDGTIYSVKLPELLARLPSNPGDSDEPDEATKLIQQAEAVLIAEMEKIEAKAEGIMTVSPVTEEGEEKEEPEQINLMDIGSTSKLISAAYGQAISGRVPGALDFGFEEWDDTSHFLDQIGPYCLSGSWRTGKFASTGYFSGKRLPCSSPNLSISTANVCFLAGRPI